VIYPGSTPVGNATLVVANVLTCNKHSHKGGQHLQDAGWHQDKILLLLRTPRSSVGAHTYSW
jgi:hypothetical protein